MIRASEETSICSRACEKIESRAIDRDDEEARRRRGREQCSTLSIHTLLHVRTCGGSFEFYRATTAANSKFKGARRKKIEAKNVYGLYVVVFFFSFYIRDTLPWWRAAVYRGKIISRCSIAHLLICITYKWTYNIPRGTRNPLPSAAISRRSH